MSHLGHLSYWKLHFGSDVLCASWLFIASTTLFVIIPVHDVIVDKNLDTNDIFYYSTYILSSVLSLLGSFAFLSVSYPEAMDSMMNDIMSQDVSKMTYLQKYFIGNNLLIMTWFFNLALVPLIIYYIWAVAVGELKGISGVILIVVMIITVASLFLWVVACFPENLVKNEGRGSTYFFDFLKDNGLLCGNEQFWKENMYGDFLAGSWIFFIMTIAYFPPVVLYLFEYPTNPDAIMYFVAVALLVIGCGLFVHASYPGNSTSDLSWRIITCTYDGKTRLFVAAPIPDETTALISPSIRV